MKVDFEILLHDCCAQKQHKISSWGLGSWIQEPKNTMVEIKTLQRVRRETNSLGGYEDLNSHGYMKL